LLFINSEFYSPIIENINRMQTKQLWFILLMGIFLLTGCKKADTSILELIQGKWALVTQIDFVAVNGTSFPITYTGTSADYINFSSDGKLTGYEDGTTINATYSVSGTQLTVTSGGSSVVYIIKTLTDSSLVLDNLVTVDANNYEEITITFKK
jgi:hypothetical protein